MKQTLLYLSSLIILNISIYNLYLSRAKIAFASTLSDVQYERLSTTNTATVATIKVAPVSIKQNRLNYAINKPSHIYEMPEKLKELSGIAIQEENFVYCIQDEEGTIYEFSLVDKTITDSYRFTGSGDFEDITVHGNRILALRSDGVIFDFDPQNIKTTNTKSKIASNSTNSEGLFYDKTNDIIYVASKDKSINGSTSERLIYKYKATLPYRLLGSIRIDTDELQQQFSTHFPDQSFHKFKFNPSAIALHPITNEMYILSSKPRAIIVYKNAELKTISLLPKALYYQPEGISFFKNGDMLIANEGNKKGTIKGSICLLKYTVKP